jgi:tRNA threonylcarbamoyladenosine biosynthesis protein TsaB
MGNMGNIHRDTDQKTNVATEEGVVLAVETSSRTGSVAVATTDRLWDQATFSAPLRHSAEILPTIARLLHRIGRTPRHVAQVHISVGPGSFTGLRIAVTLAKSMNLANRTQIIAVDTLDVMAANVDDAAPAVLFHNALAESCEIRRIATLLDAKRGQFFVAAYERASLDPAPPADDPGYRIPAPGATVWRKVLPDCLMSASAFLEQFADATDPIALLGDGLLYHQDKFAAEGVCILDSTLWSPRAANVHLLGYQKARAGLFSDPLTLVPFYLRGPQVTLKARS